MKSTDPRYAPNSSDADSAGKAGAFPTTQHVRYRTEPVGEVDVFYREAGPRSAPTVLLLHGFAASSYMYRDVIAALAGKYHVVAPDLPSFGFTRAPASGEYDYTFDNLTKTIEGFIDQLKLERYALMVHDYGAPIGWRLASAHPERITALISQNGNAYEAGLAPAWDPIRTYWEQPIAANRLALAEFPTAASIKWQYLEGVKEVASVAPDGYTLEGLQVSRPGNAEIQLDLLLDYASNVTLYPAFQEYFRQHQPPMLAVWGRNDPFFLPEGAEAWKRDIPKAEVHFFDTGHFALETHAELIIPILRDFLDRSIRADAGEVR